MHPRARKRIGNRRTHRIAITNLDDGLQRRRQIPAVVMQHWRARTQLRLAHRCIGIAAKVIIKAPAANKLAHLKHFRRAAQAANLIKQTVEIRRVLRQYIPFALGACADHRAVAIHQQAGGAVKRAGPDAFALDLRVEAESRRNGARLLGQHEVAVRVGKPQADRVAEIFPGEPQAQSLHALAYRRLDRHLTIAHAPADGFRPGPEGRLQSAFTGQRIDYATLSGFRQQAQGSVEIGFAAAIGASDQVQTAERNHQFVDRTVIAHRESIEHGIPSLQAPIVGAAEGCDLLMLFLKDQKIAAYGSSFRKYGGRTGER
ncbi:hypothetical protein D3C76_310710 [compost metagenome]